MTLISTDDGAKIYCKVDGEPGKPALLLSNSLGTNLGMWDDQVPVFAEHFRIIRYDSRGHGKSSAPAGDYTMDRLGKDALAVLDAHDVNRAYYCGLSKGGMVGMWLGSNAPDRLRRAVFCNTSANPGMPEVWAERIRAVRANGMSAVEDGILERWFTAKFRDTAPARVDKVRQMLRTTPPQGYAGCSAAIRDMNQEESIRTIRLPVMVVIGEFDPATPPDHGRKIHQAINGSKLVEIKDAAHLTNIEQTEIYNKAVLDFLRG